MTPDNPASCDALLRRADRAIADAVAIRARVQAGLDAAARRTIHRAGCDARPSVPPFAQTLPVLEPWWSVARTLNAALDIMREADLELEAAWSRVQPTIATSPTLFRG